MEPPPEVLKAADNCGSLQNFRKMVVNMKSTRVIHSRSAVAQDVERRRQNAFDFAPGQWSGLEFDLGPTQTGIAALVTQARVVLDGEQSVTRNRLTGVTA